MSALPAPDNHTALPAAASRSQAIRYGAYMLRRFGWFYKVLGLGRLLGRLRLEEHSVDRIRSAADTGPVVYVLLERSTLDHLALNTVLNKRRLPLSVWANGVRAFWWQPVVPAWSDVLRRVRGIFASGRPPDPVASGWLARTIASNAPVTVFLDQRRLRARAGAEHPLAAVVEAQSMTGAPIQLLPVVVLWGRSPEVRGGVVRAFVTGGRVRRGGLGRIRDLLLRSNNALVQVGDPLDVRAFCARVRDEDRRPRALHTLLRRYLRRESRVVLGPRLLPRKDLKRVVLDNPPMRALAQREADVSGRTVGQVRREMERDYAAMAANFRWWVIRLLEIVLRPLWTRVFAGVDIREQDVERIRAAMRDGSAVLVPSHKSHFDYVLLSWVFFSHDLIVPHIVAGMNLAIWPVSIFLRGAGAFFIKRTFAGDRLFPAVFSRYLRELLRLGYPVEFFIEGGRTRSGKLLPPKVGVLSMVLDAASVRPTGQEVTILPVSFAYEEVAEAKVYARELSGEDKRPETLGQVVKAGRVFGNRYGRAYVRVGDPVRTSGIVDASEQRAGWLDLDADTRKVELHRVAERVLHRIGQATVVLPTSLVAAAVLAHHRRGIRHEALVERVERFRQFLDRCDAPLAASLERFSQATSEALAKLHRTHLLESYGERERVWSVPVDRRITLEFYKNQLVHWFAPAGYVTIAVRALPEGPFTADGLRAGVAAVAWMFRREFVLDPDVPLTATLGRGLSHLAAHGAIAADGDGWVVADPVRMGEVHGLFRPLVEAYGLVLRHVSHAVRHRIDRSDLAKAIQANREAWMASGELTRPEALSLVNLENAIATYIEDGVIRQDSHGHLVVDASRRDARLDALVPFLP